MFKITGTIKMIGETTPVTEKFTKREFVIQDEASQYPQLILFQLTQDKCALLDSCMEGEQIDVSFNLRGREWTSPQGETKYFNTLEAWRIEKVSYQNDTKSSEPTPKSVEKPKASVEAQPAVTEEDDDDLPF